MSRTVIMFGPLLKASDYPIVVFLSIDTDVLFYSYTNQNRGTCNCNINSISK